MKYKPTNTPWRDGSGYIVGKNGKCIGNIYGPDYEANHRICIAAPELYAAVFAVKNGDPLADEFVQAALKKTGDL